MTPTSPPRARWPEALFDMQRVEVLRGPQGTLFGRNATGGLIQYFSNQPTDNLDGYLDVTGGNFSRIDSEGAIGGPLTDTLAARAAFATNYHEGYITNDLGGRINNQRQFAGRAAIHLEIRRQRRGAPEVARHQQRLGSRGQLFLGCLGAR